MAALNGGNLSGGTLWTLLLGGLGLALAGLVQSGERFRRWKQTQEFTAGEVVPEMGTLKRGQCVILAPANILQANDKAFEPGAEGVHARIVNMTRRLLVLRLERGDLPEAEEEFALPDFAQCGGKACVSLTGGAALYRFPVRVVDARRDTENPAAYLIHVSRPAFLARVQRRDYARAEVRIPATIAILPEIPDVAAAIVRGTVVDLGSGGLCLDIACQASPDRAASLISVLKEGTHLRIRLELPELGSAPLLMHVGRSQRHLVRSGMSVRVAGPLLELTAHERELLTARVFQAERERLKRQRQF